MSKINDVRNLAKENFISDFSSNMLSEADKRLPIFSVGLDNFVNMTCFSEFKHEWKSSAPYFEEDKDKLYQNIVVCNILQFKITGRNYSLIYFLWIQEHEDLEEVSQFMELLGNYNFSNIKYFSTLQIKLARHK